MTDVTPQTETPKNPTEPTTLEAHTNSVVIGGNVGERAHVIVTLDPSTASAEPAASGHSQSVVVKGDIAADARIEIKVGGETIAAKTLETSSEHDLDIIVIETIQEAATDKKKIIAGSVALVAAAAFVGAWLGAKHPADKPLPLAEPTPAQNTLKAARIAASNNVMFATGSAILPIGSELVLKNIADELKASGEIVCLTVTGHASRTGPDSLNQSLSGERAEKAANELKYVFALPARMVRTESTGTTVTQGSAPEYDQRVTFALTPGACR